RFHQSARTWHRRKGKQAAQKRNICVASHQRPDPRSRHAYLGRRVAILPETAVRQVRALTRDLHHRMMVRLMTACCGDRATDKSWFAKARLPSGFLAGADFLPAARTLVVLQDFLA